MHVQQISSLMSSLIVAVIAIVVIPSTATAASLPQAASPVLDLLLGAWTARFSSLSPDGLGGSALAWDWLSNACAGVPCQNKATVTANVVFQGTSFSAQV